MKDTIIRTVIAALALMNSILVMVGKTPLILNESVIYEMCSGIFLAGSTIAVWWRNNSFTKAAQEADRIKDALKLENATANFETDEVFEDNLTDLEE